MARTLSAFWLLVGLVCFPNTECWEAPGFCRGYVCPMFTVVGKYQGFEEREYGMSNWITTDVKSTSDSDLKTGFFKLYDFDKGKNSKNEKIEMTMPVLVSVKESDDAGGRQVSISVFLPNPDIPDPTDTTIRKTIMPGGTFYIRSFGGFATEADGFENVRNLRDDLKAAGKEFIEDEFYAAGYDAPWNLINRHNEVWVRAA